MFRLPGLNIDRLSFWLGFLAASLLWWLVARVRPLLPHWQKQIRIFFTNIRQKSLSGVDAYIREETIRRAQTRHIAFSLFSLDEICIQPMLLAPPPRQSPGDEFPAHSIASQVIPYLPDWPEAVSRFGIPILTPLQAIQKGQNIAIIGQPGCGKTVTLAHLACQLARKENTSPDSANYLPILTHILDLQFEQTNDQDLLQAATRDISSRSPVTIRSQFTTYLKGMHQDDHSRLVLLLDGLDELPPTSLQQAMKYIETLIGQYPRIQIITAASSTYLDGLIRIGFIPLAVQAWSPTTRAQLAQKWSGLWRKHFETSIKKLPEYQTVDLQLFDFWLSGDEAPYLNPLEWTLRLWGAFAGSLSGSRPTDIIHAHVIRNLSDPAEIEAVSALALHMIENGIPDIAFEDAEKALNSSRRLRPAQPLDSPSEEQAPQPANQPAKKKSRRLILSPGARMLTELTNAGILHENHGERFRFTCPLFFGYLAAIRLQAETVPQVASLFQWPAVVEALHYASARPEHSPWVLNLIENPAPPLFISLLTASQWLRDAPAAAQWRSPLMRALVNLVQDEAYPIGIRLKFITAFYLSRDPSVSKLFKHLLASHSPDLRRIALIGCGALGDQQLIDDILKCVADPVEEVRLTACLALSAVPGDTALNALVEILSSGDEESRRAAAEGLASNTQDGHKLLEEAAAIEDLLVRRAAVFGLALIDKTWSRKLLETIAVEDSQWVVRNAASQALELQHPIENYIPQPLPPVWESPWLLSFASKLGMGIPPGSDALDVLEIALNSGSEEEQIAALDYLHNHPTEAVLAKLYQLVFGNQEELRAAALQALWLINLSGVDLPMPEQYGLS